MSEETKANKPILKKPWFWIAIVVVIVLVAGIAGGQSKEEVDDQQQTQSSTAESSSANSQSPAETKLSHGELLDLTSNDGLTVIKAKIEPSYSNEATIEQNYFNVEQYIKDNNRDDVEELQYWAVADMTSGKESKVISFSVSKELISQVKDGKVVANQLGEHVSDLWILPSLRK